MPKPLSAMLSIVEKEAAQRRGKYGVARGLRMAHLGGYDS
jgi:hypothetical protein